MLNSRTKVRLEMALGRFERTLSLLEESLQPRSGFLRRRSAVELSVEQRQTLDLVLESVRAEIQCLADSVGLQLPHITAYWDVMDGLVEVLSELEWIERELQCEGDGVEPDEHLAWHLERLIAFVPFIVGLLPEKVRKSGLR